MTSDFRIEILRSAAIFPAVTLQRSENPETRESRIHWMSIVSFQGCNRLKLFGTTKTVRIRDIQETQKVIIG